MANVQNTTAVLLDAKEEILWTSTNLTVTLATPGSWLLQYEVRGPKAQS